MSAPAVRVTRIELFERPVRLRLPFRFGAATVTAAPQAFVRVEASIDGKSSVGATAELMVPKWFDKSPALTQEQNFDQLRLALRLAADAYLAAGAAPSAHALAVTAGAAALREGQSRGLPRLAAQFGPAEIDKAVADAVLRATGHDWVAGVSAGLLGDPWSRSLQLRRPMDVVLRHTVGLADRLSPVDPGEPLGDGLPATLDAAIADYGLTYFKLKLSGQADADIHRLAAISAVLQRHAAPDWRVTLDGNESFADAGALARFWQRLFREPALALLLQRTLLLEQPLPRALALEQSVAGLGIQVPVIIDESDDHEAAFDTARALGYAGVSSKACKGLYRSLRNAHHVASQAAAGLLLSGEDLTCQAGLAVQQDTLLAASLGVGHIERNGHHYVDGFGAAPLMEARGFAEAHAGFYDPATRRLRVQQGRLDLSSLHVPGFASAALPDWSSLSFMSKE